MGNRGSTLFVRALDALDPVAVFTGAPRGPFVSPDGQWIGFVDGAVLKKVTMTGGPAATLAPLDGAFRGATWGPDDTIIFATSNVRLGCSGLRAGDRQPSSRGPTARRAKPITCGRSCCRAAGLCCSR